MTFYLANPDTQSLCYPQLLTAVGRAQSAGFHAYRVRHEILYNFAQNLDQNGLLGQKLGQLGNWSLIFWDPKKSISKILTDRFSF